MNNNDILRRVRYILDARDNQIVAIFKQADITVSESQVNHWLKRDDDVDYVALQDQELLDFLDALIIKMRGKKDGPAIKFKQTLNNNVILMKLKIAFQLKSEEVLSLMQLAGFKISKHELSALFRKQDHKHYRACKNQMLRKFMKGLQLKYRSPTKQNPSKQTMTKNVKSSNNIWKIPGKK